jgi:extradiol dioxygenase
MIYALGYIGISATAPDGWREFGSEILGLQVVDDERADNITFRMDDRAARIIVEPSPVNGIAYLGWEVAGPVELDALHERLKAAGHDPVVGSEDTRRARQVQGLIQCVDPGGTPLEFFHGQLTVNEPFRPGRAISGFTTGSLGLGHLVLAVDDVDSVVRFYRETLDFRLSDQLGNTLYFLRCNARHHSIGLARVGNEARLLHIMLELSSLEDVGCALDLCLDRGLDVTTLGVHSNDRMTSFYVTTPSGFEIEYGWNGLLVDDETWSETTIDRPSVWGHRQLNAEHLPTPRPLQRVRQRP